jgi:hypothetical protein
LPSKLVAGGLSAAVVLLWWPRFFPSDSVESWLARGVVWTLCVETMILAFVPLEAALWDTRAGQRLRGRAHAARRRLDADSPRRRLGAACSVAALAVGAATTAILLGPPRAPQSPRVATRHVTEVKRIVRVVKKPVRVIAQAPAVPAPAAPLTQPTTVRSSHAGMQTRNKTQQPKRSEPTPSDTQLRHEPVQQPQQSQPQQQAGGGGAAQAPVTG